MNNKNLPFAKFFIATIVCALALSSCGNKLEAQSEVLLKAKEAIIAAESGEVEVTAAVNGGNGDDDLQFTGDLNLVFDKSDIENRKIDLQVDLSGLMKAGEQVLNGDLDAQLIALSNEYYVKLDELSSSDGSLASVEPFIDLYKGKWLRVAEDFIPENIRNLQGEDEATTLKRQQLETLFLETELFKVSKDYGIEKLSGNNVYHYDLEVDKDAFGDYIRKASIIDGRELTKAEIEESIAILDYIEVLEVYIDTTNYHTHKAVLSVSGQALSQEANLEVEVVILTENLNDSVNVSAPESAEEFNPLSLLMGLGAESPEVNELDTLETPEEVIESSEGGDID
jgi:hypothetical protein